jgi:hypothetical protein
MKLSISSAILAAAKAGLVLGAVSACASSTPAPDDATSVAAEGAKACCKAMNDCKGKGGCRAGEHSCKGQNECKGQGGCSAHCPK